MRASTRQPWVRRRLAEVPHLLRHPSALFGPSVLARLAWDRLAGQADAGDWRVTPLRGGDGWRRSTAVITGETFTTMEFMRWRQRWQSNDDGNQ